LPASSNAGADAEFFVNPTAPSVPRRAVARDFAPVTQVLSLPGILIAQLSRASAGTGSSPLLSMALLANPAAAGAFSARAL
jgi:hypothetical protein